MGFRTGGATATLLIGLTTAGGQAVAQYYPLPPPPTYRPAQAYPAPPGYPPYRPQQPVDAEDDDEPSHEPPMILSRPLPPAAIGPQVYEPPAPPGPPMSRRHPSQIQEAELPPPPPAGYIYRDPPPPVGVPQQGHPHSTPPPAPVPQSGYRDAPPQQAYPEAPPPGVQGGYEPAASGTRPYYGPPLGPRTLQPLPPPAAYPAAPSEQQDAFRPPMPIGPGQADPSGTGAVRGDPRTHMAALPPEVRPETGPRKELPLQFRRTLVDYRTKEPAGTIIIDTQNTFLYLTLGNGKAIRYGVGVGREGFTWSGAEKVTKMAEWPDWNPPTEMIERQPYLPRFMAGGEGNPLGARALYLGKTIYRIHGTNQPSTIGSFVSSGCIRLTNEDVMDLYGRVKVGTRVVVLPGSPPPGATATPGGHQPPAAVPGAPPVSMAPPLAPPRAAIAR
jgi:lipoprotein-anchoring transpeptidase ErfK/SrfK